jgi:hypothetical protein
MQDVPPVGGRLAALLAHEPGLRGLEAPAPRQVIVGGLGGPELERAIGGGNAVERSRGRFDPADLGPALGAAEIGERREDPIEHGELFGTERSLGPVDLEPPGRRDERVEDLGRLVVGRHVVPRVAGGRRGHGVVRRDQQWLEDASRQLGR